MKKNIALMLAVLCLFMLSGCREKSDEKTEINVFVAASLSDAMTEIAEKYNEMFPDVNVIINADSSGTLLTQIKEGYDCDIFFPASTVQMEELEKMGLVSMKQNILNNKLVVIKGKDSNTEVTGLSDIYKAESIALAGESVPAGQYTRQALINLGMLSEDKDAKDYTSAEISSALGGVEISEQSNVSKALIAVAEGACQVGTAYYSDVYGYEDKVDIIEIVDQSLTGDIIYPIGVIRNEVPYKQQDEVYSFYASVYNSGKEIFEKYNFECLADGLLIN